MKKLFDLQIVSISHYQSCTGSVFLHSLLDGHPEICTIPGVPNFMPLISSIYDSAEDAFKIFELSNPKFYDTSKMSRIDQNSSGLYCLGEAMDEGIITNKILFREHFFQHMYGEELSIKNLIISLYYAYARSHYFDISKFKILLLHPHEREITFIFDEIFPKSKYLIPIRNPIRAYCSSIKLRKEKANARNQPYIPTGQLLSSAVNLYEYCKRNMDICIFRIEDFGSKKEKKILKLISKYIGIEYNNSMESSTFGSKTFWGANPSFKTKVFDKKRHSLPIPLSRYEKNLFYSLNKEFNLVAGYPMKEFSLLDSSLSLFWLLLPLKDEIKWFHNAFFKKKYKGMKYSNGNSFSILKSTLGLIKERISVLYIFIRNYNSRHYKCIAKSLLLPIDSNK